MALARRHREFDPRAHVRELACVIDEIAALPELDARSLDRIVKRHPRRGCGLFSKSEIIAGYRTLGAADRWPLDEVSFVARLRKRPIRTLSGVTPVTVLTRPHPCPGRCIFCPNDVRMPKSYLADEPGAQRAEANRFDPYLQTWNRLSAYRDIGHPVDKVELIVLGGTWSFLPEPYQRWFVKRCFDAMNDFGAALDGRPEAEALAAPAGFRELPERLDGENLERSYNQQVSAFLGRERDEQLLHERERASWGELEEAQRKNEVAGARCVGLSLETRPDRVTQEEVVRLRRLGATKIQLGIQSLSDRVLDMNQRGHDVAATRRALALLRRLGFKLQAHYMVNLLGATPEGDVAGFQSLFEDPDFRPDELKLYPCALIESAELVGHWRRGEWRPYPEAELLEVLEACLEQVPEYCRLSRVIRDFSAHDIVTGSRTANLREVAEDRIRLRSGRLRDIRSREIRDKGCDVEALELIDRVYASSTGEEHFLELQTGDDRLAGFLRLSLPDGRAPLDELESCALLREVHVYGASLALGLRTDGQAQHRGLGRRLVDRALELARTAGYARLAVISAVGTREYYRALGFEDGELYQSKAI